MLRNRLLSSIYTFILPYLSHFWIKPIIFFQPRCFLRCLNYYLCPTAGVQRLLERARQSVRRTTRLFIKQELRLVLSSAASLFCLNIRSFGNVAASAATPALAERQQHIFSRQLFFCLHLLRMNLYEERTVSLIYKIHIMYYILQSSTSPNVILFPF